MPDLTWDEIVAEANRAARRRRISEEENSKDESE